MFLVDGYTPSSPPNTHAMAKNEREREREGGRERGTRRILAFASVSSGVGCGLSAVNDFAPQYGQLIYW